MLKTIVFSLLILAIQCEKEKPEEPTYIQVLTDTNIHDFIHKNHRAMIFFYTPGCGPCENFLPQVEKAAYYMQEEGIPFGKLEAEGNKDSAKLYSVTGYPTLLWFEDGTNKTKYEGGRTYDAIQMWIYEKINPGTQEAATVDDVKAQISEHDAVFFFFGDDPKDRTFRRYREFSYTMSTPIFRHTFAKGAAKAVGVPEKTQIAVFKKFDKSPILFTSKQLKIPELRAFTELNMLPRVTVWTDDIQTRVLKKEKQALILYSNGDEYIINLFKEFAYKNFPVEDYLLMIHAEKSHESYTKLQRMFGIWDHDLESGPKLLLVMKNGFQKYLFKGEFSLRNLENFVYDSRDGKVPKHFRSQESPIQLKSDSVFEFLTGATYVSKVLESPLDWLVVFIDSREKSQLDVVSVVARVAMKLANNKNIVFGVTDASQNEYPDFEESIDLVRLRLYKGAPGKKQFMRFTLKANKLQEERLVNFIYDHTSYEWVPVRDDL